MPSQNDVDSNARRALNSARIRYMTLSLILIAAHLGGLQPSDEVQVFGLRLAEAERPEYIYTLIWAALFWLTFVYWQYYRDSPDRSAERSFVTENLKHRALQAWLADQPEREGQRYDEIKVAPDHRSVTLCVHKSSDSDEPAETYDVNPTIVRSARWHARKALILYKPETIALRLPFALALVAVIAAFWDQQLA